ncbi:MAG: hypothetical protein A2Z18_10360 [Armatimonadetes bacterium RBG_16_58_9]|nr:MAG: hypothetical protein A2Z18_10360 [Armatimonadetes bacterium RBG_16_58_9]
MRNRGFTIVELLVVVAIIAILAAMIMPVLLQAQEAAQMRTCASNLRQLGQAITQYIDDSDGFGLPTPGLDYENPWVLCPLPLRRYLGQAMTPVRKGPATARYRRIWICPGDINRGPVQNPESGWEDGDTPYWWNRGSSYMYPGTTAYLTPSAVWPTNLRAKDPTVRPLRPFEWRNHKRDLLLSDYWFDFHTGRCVQHTDSITAPAWVSRLDVKGTNVLFLDCHLESVTPAQREKYIEFTRHTDNPHYAQPKP